VAGGQASLITQRLSFQYWRTLLHAACCAVPKGKIALRHVIYSFATLVILFLFSLNFVFGIFPGEWFEGARKTELRLILSLICYVLFMINLAAVIALLNRLKPGG
jgi:hypothetical protein